MPKDLKKHERYVRTFGGRRYTVEYSPRLQAWKVWVVEVCEFTGRCLQKAVSEMSVFDHADDHQVFQFVNDEIDYQVQRLGNRAYKAPTAWRRQTQMTAIL